MHVKLQLEYIHVFIVVELPKFAKHLKYYCSYFHVVSFESTMPQFDAGFPVPKNDVKTIKKMKELSQDQL